MTDLPLKEWTRMYGWPEKAYSAENKENNLRACVYREHVKWSWMVSFRQDDVFTSDKGRAHTVKQAKRDAFKRLAELYSERDENG